MPANGRWDLIQRLNLNFSTDFRKNIHEDRLVGAGLSDAGRQSDTEGEANSRFSQFYEGA